MIKYNNKTINDWYFDNKNVIKVYKNNAVCYYKIVSGGGTPSQEPCFAVVEDITQYSDTEFIDVYDKATDKWYKLNNLDQYEQYGVYGEGRNITYYVGKLTIDNGYEYEWDGSEWSNLGEVTGSTATLPNVPFTVNINAKNYDAATKTFAKTNGQLADTDIVISEGTPVLHDGYVTVSINTRGVITGYQTYFNRDANNPTLTIISKQRTNGSNCHLFANRDSNYNWMYRAYSDRLTLHGNGETGSLAVTSQPVIESVRVSSERTVTYNNYTDSTTSSTSNFTYGGTNSGGVALFAGYAVDSSEWFTGDFYWLYMSQTTLTDEQVQQVIDYNEGDAISEYPKYYTEKDEPENNVVFEDMEEALAYECPWVGMDVTIDNTPYLFGDAYEWLTKYGLFEVSGEYICDNGDKYEKMEEMVRNTDGTWSSQIPAVYEKGDLIEAGSSDCSSRLPDGYTEVEYIENTSSAYINTGFKPNQDTRITCEMQCVTSTNSVLHFGAGGWDKVNGMWLTYETGVNGTLHISWLGKTVWSTYSSVHGDYNRHTYDWNKNNIYKDSVLVASNTYGNYNCSDNLAIFTTIQNGISSESSLKMLGRVYWFKIYDNGTLVRDLVPCIRDADNRVGAYDLVNNVFYGSGNNNRFVAGNPV